MKTLRLTTLIAFALTTSLTMTACQKPSPDSVQRGYRGTGMAHVENPDDAAAIVAANTVPDPQPKVPSAGPKAGDVYQNVKVLGDLSVGEFTRVMLAITEWVSPDEGCNYCHVNEGFQSDQKYTKKVARVMIAMTQRANQDWGDHVGETGVTCYTCHRGKHIPEYVWSQNPGHDHAPGITTAMQNVVSKTAVNTSLPYDAFTPFLQGDASIRMASETALPTGNRASIKQTEWVYSLMMHFSDSLGVNCSHCHNTRAFARWDESSPERVKAWYGIRMVREMNNNFIGTTSEYAPDHRKGPMGDPLKVNCGTCHQGAYQPLLGAKMLKDYPNLAGYNAQVRDDYVKDLNTEGAKSSSSGQ